MGWRESGQMPTVGWKPTERACLNLSYRLAPLDEEPLRVGFVA